MKNTIIKIASTFITIAMIIILWPESDTHLFVSFLLTCIASVADGVVEGWEFDSRKSFERKFNANPNGFWGSLSHRNKGTYWYKITHAVWDFYHLADDLRSYFYRIGGFLFSFFIVGQSFFISIISVIFFLGANSVCKRYSMEWIRS